MSPPPNHNHTDENASPRDQQQQQGQKKRYHQITKTGPPSKEELAERQRKLAEWKRERELKKLGKEPKASINEAVEIQESTNIEVEEKLDFSWRNEIFWLNHNVFLKIQGSDQLIPIPKPHLRLYRLDQVEAALEKGQTELAEAMLSVIGAPGQLPFNDAASRSKRFQRVKRRFETVGTESIEEMVEPIINLPPSPLPEHLKPIEVEDDEVLSQLQEACEEVTRRQSAIFDTRPMTPEFHSVNRAAKFILEEDLLGSGRKRLFSEGHGGSQTEGRKQKRIHVDLSNDTDDEASGSTVKYALMTPTKRIQEMLQTDLVVSPVRRSFRNPSGPALLDDPAEIPEDRDVCYLPNPSVDASPCKNK